MNKPNPNATNTSVDNIDRFLEANAAEDFCPVEYKVVRFVEIDTLEGDSFEEFLNSLGAVGWELVHSDKTYMIFSRC
jgi:hypothetical protein